MKTYVDYIVIGMKEHLIYPGSVWAKLFAKIIYLYLQFSIWNALFIQKNQINPLLNKEETLRYIIVATIISTFIECNTIEWINNQIRTGNIAMELIRPMDFRKMVFSRHIGDTAIKVLFYCIPLSVLVTVIINKPLLCIAQILPGLLSVGLAYCIQFLYALIIGLLAFWLIVTWPLNMLLNAIYKLLSGVWIPVTMFPEFLYKLNCFLPFRAIYAIPVTILTSRMKGQDVLENIIIQLIWIIVLFCIMELVWKIGKKKLIVQGG